MSDQLISEFVSITNSSKYLAEQYLSRNNNDLMEAVEDYYANDGNSASTPTSNQFQNADNASGSGRLRTLRDLNDDGGDDSADEKDMNYFTGGEKSGLQVENPNKDRRKGGNSQNDQSIIDQIFQRAKEQTNQPDDRPSAGDEPQQPKFSGRGFKLGDGNEPSQEIADPNANIFRPTKVNREITFWKQGFTVGETGELHRYDDPRNASILQELNQGRVPMSILDVEFGQDVDVSVFKKTDEEWKPPSLSRKAAGYFGKGQRLGSPVPGEPIVTESSSPQKEVVSSAPSEPQGEGDSLVQIRFANGKKTAHKFNSSDAVTKVYDFVRNHEYNDPSKEFNLSHAFPVKPIEDTSDITVADAKLKNAVIVQRWKI
ncbi:uncharacterized protein SPAPADRAFT_59889 [Spathaspora passalidarum NRRL Y-27907]|uniref:UBX domain-containing protein 1 n=1 Tax=Spathaspora passalidarum (strain NRRL Y-27907 / 11-Y1) TaxID=619300 RepID=G3AIP9_SPAPN|nr:uncharacterized protein SPAPADRAFT_59889 [Spathaspora passalidarum NRRL Y-27907]EGW34465.1 hypothetical protein SPAPADRAFT_59889 [Spathaspora passalidarum NRRL Y-27907]